MIKIVVLESNEGLDRFGPLYADADIIVRRRSGYEVMKSKARGPRIVYGLEDLTDLL